MKKGEKPKLDQAWWKKNKAKTLKSTGFGEAIKEYTDLKATLAKGGLYERTYANFAKADSALKNVEVVRKKAIGMCGKLHDETKDGLVAYDAVIKAEAAVLSSLKKDYDKFVDKFATTKRNGFREMPARETDWKEMKKKVDATVKTGNASLTSEDKKAIKMSLDLALSVKKEVEALVAQTIKSCDLYRIQTTDMKPCGEDQPDDLAQLLDKWANYMKDNYAPTKQYCEQALDKAITRLEMGFSNKDLKKAGEALKNLK